MKNGGDDRPVRPTHVAIIMDGNGRWASRHGKPRHSGHRAGVKSAREVVEACAESDVKVLTLFAFSSENWKRPPSEVDALMRLFVEVLQREVDTLHENGIQLRFIGNRESLPTILRKRMADAEARTASNSRMTLVLAVAYGGQWDMVQAMRRIGQKVRSGDLDPADIDEGLWDLAYTELCFTDTLWPDFGTEQMVAALGFFSQRQRRFGRTGDQLEAIAD
jgi:undecaprenyl diphosphate synthase